MKKMLAVALITALMVPTTAEAAGTGIDLRHVCTLDSGKERFKIENQSHKSQSVRMVTGFHNERYGVDEGQTIKVRARVSQGNGLAELRQHGQVIDREYATYKPC